MPQEIEDVFRPQYKELTPEIKELIFILKAQAYIVYCTIVNGTNPSNMRELALAKTHLEESIMWAVKGLTK